MNIIDIIRYKLPQTPLYDVVIGATVYLRGNSNDKIFCSYSNKVIEYNKEGKLYNNNDAIQALTPSREMRDWSKLAWNKGDILVNKDENVHIIFKGFSKNDYTTFEGKHWISVSKKRYLPCLNMQNVQDYHIEDNKDAAKTYINTIEQHLGCKLNLESLKIEKQPEFKDGDIVVYGESVAICRKIYKHTLYFYVSLDETFGLLFDDNCVSAEGYRFATAEDKQQLFDALAKKGKAWYAEKKQIVDLKPKCEFKPFDRCIWKIRNCEGSIWQASFVSYVDEYGATPMGMSIDEDLVNLIILPYNDQTKLLVGTTDEWEGGEHD